MDARAKRLMGKPRLRRKANQTDGLVRKIERWGLTRVCSRYRLRIKRAGVSQAKNEQPERTRRLTDRPSNQTAPRRPSTPLDDPRDQDRLEILSERYRDVEHFRRRAKETKQSQPSISSLGSRRVRSPTSDEEARYPVQSAPSELAQRQRARRSVVVSFASKLNRRLTSSLSGASSSGANPNAQAYTAMPKLPSRAERSRSASMEDMPMAKEERLKVARKVKTTAIIVMSHFL